jgi:hypothetical protein
MMAIPESFIVLAEQAGLPVKMLRAVQQNYSINVTTRGSGYTDPARNKLYVNAEKYDLLKGARLGPGGAHNQPFQDEFEAVNELYHEATHAYMDLALGRGKEDAYLANETRRFESVFAKRVISKYSNYYFGAQLREARPCSWRDHWRGKLVNRVTNSEDVLHESIAMYVGMRAAQYWRSFDKLTLFRDHSDARNWGKVLKFVQEEVLQYNKAMSGRVVGYEDRCGVTVPLANRAIPDEVRDLCNRLLENKIPDNLFEAPKLSQLYRDISARASAAVKR